MDNNRGFPPSNPPPRVIDFASLCEFADGSRDVPVAYNFGGGAPTTIKAENVEIETLQAGGRREFVEFDPYAWVP